MLIGEFSHSLDAKGRVNFPAKLREELGERFYIARSLMDKCLYVYSQEEWDRLAEGVGKLPFDQASAVQQWLFSSAYEAEPDKQGRVNIPQNLRDLAGLDREVVIIGAMVRAEIWDKGLWEQKQSGISQESMKTIISNIVF